MVATDMARKEHPHNPCIPVWLCTECSRWEPRVTGNESSVVDARHLRLIPKLRPGRGGQPFDYWPATLEPEEDAFLEASLDATTDHEPPAYPAEKLEWSDQLAGTDPND